MDPTHRALWAQPNGLGDLGELMARWLEGSISYQPADGGTEPDPETAHLVPVLAAANRAGLVTHFSQPGVPLVDGSGQRAAVLGFCSEDTAIGLQEVSTGTELVLLTYAPGATSDAQVVVTLDVGTEFTFVGAPTDTANIDHYYADDLSAQGLAALHDAWQICLFDPRWGCDDLLWDTLGTWIREER